MAQVQACESCGAKILPEHVDQGRAGRWAGKLLCAACFAEKKGPGPAEKPAAGPAPLAAQLDKDEPISLEDAPDGDAAGPKIQSFSQQATSMTPRRKQYTRQPVADGKGACRVRTFHSKLQVESIEFMDNAINEWLDDNPAIEVKFVTTTIGTMAGKHPEPNLILNVWY